ncbi:hypothetical protein AVEN_177643-1 [Araneus ventricosus]|uniref:Uncharacterized protein n=1 Tax=Araneus ventricosus TaxID=182803 RepID=A0A4Y2KZ94_ARAVE|nr:hypothetical protein AVEN_177643-1 [Araneus ventricosus]
MNAVSIPGSEELEVLSPSCIEIVQIKFQNFSFEVHSVTITTTCVPNIMAVNAIDSSAHRRQTHTHTNIAFYEYRREGESNVEMEDISYEEAGEDIDESDELSEDLEKA